MDTFYRARYQLLRDISGQNPKFSLISKEHLNYAVLNDNLDNMEWLREQGCPWNKQTFENVAKIGNLGIMKWLRDQGCHWNIWTFAYAAKNGNLENMKWLKEQGCPWDEWAFAYAAKNGNLENMKWLREQECPWNEWTFKGVAKNGNLDNMKWLKEQGCPWKSTLRTGLFYRPGRLSAAILWPLLSVLNSGRRCPLFVPWS